jgi:hypothetical protein
VPTNRAEVDVLNAGVVNAAGRTESHSCAVCGAPTRGRKDFLVCSRCGHGDGSAGIASGVVVNEDPERIPTGRPTLLQREQLHLVAPLLRPGTQLIDVGCSNGGFLFAARRAFELGPASYGVEVSPPNIEAAQRAGLRVEHAIQEVVPGAVVTFWHSAEHFPVPRLVELLETLRERSGSRVTILVSVPNGASVQWLVTRRRWTYYDPGAHYSQFTPGSLDQLMAAAGYAPIRRRHSPVYGTFGAIQSSINLLRPRNELYIALKRGQGKLSKGTLAATGLAAIVTSPVMGALAMAEVSTSRCSVLTVEYRPR